jgi:signal transduction histidine kinase
MQSERSARPTLPPPRTDTIVPGMETARVEAEATHAQLQALQALTDTALSHLALDDLLRELLGRVTAVMGVDHVAIFLLDADGRTLTMRAARGLLEEEVGRVQIPVGQGFAGRIAASRAPLIVDDTSFFDLYGVYPLLREQLHAVVGVPLLVDDPVADQEEGHCEGQLVSRLVGVVHVGSAAPRRFIEAEVQLLQRAADRIALAIGRARMFAAEQGARRQAEAALARAQASEAQATERAERLHTILETMADGVAVYDTEGRPLQLVNHAYRELYALERGPAVYESLPSYERARLLQVRDPATGAPLPFEDTPAGRALRGEVVTGPSADLRVRAFDGRELVVNSSAAPLRDGEGRVVGAVLVLRDITERKRLEHEREAAWARAQASEARATERAERLNTILETMADGVGVFNQDGRLIQMNRAGRELLAVDRAPGFDALPFADQNFLLDTRDAVTGVLLPPEQNLVARALRGEVVSGPDADFRMRALDGRELEVNASATPLRNSDGRVVGAVLVGRDVTESKQLARESEAARADELAARADELAAREASRRLEAFLATAVHDLRSPLAATVGFLDLAERQTERLAGTVREAHPDLAPRVDAVRARLNDADEGAARLSRLLTLLFDTAAIRADKLELHRAPCDLAALVRAQVAALRAAAPGRTLRLHLPAGSKPVPVEADADRIGQVVTNYVTNALKYSPPDQPVDVSVVARRGRARVAVCDQGPGIPKEERARVWELFHQVPGVAAQGETQGGSLGLGLHISKAIIAAHGGRVGVKSVVGEGSTFWFTLPLS